MKSKFDPQKHHRRSIRLQGYDYSSEGAYYVTIVTYRRDCLFGEIKNEETPQGGCVILNDLGKIADECWRAIPEHFPFVELGAYVIMPNHVHGIIVITDQRRGAAPLQPTRRKRQSTQNQRDTWFIGRNRAIVQIRRFISCKQGTQHHRYLATQLLRTHHPQ